MTTEFLPVKEASSINRAPDIFLFTVVAPLDGGGHISGLSPPSGPPSQADPQQPNC